MFFNWVANLNVYSGLILRLRLETSKVQCKGATRGPGGL